MPKWDRSGARCGRAAPRQGELDITITLVERTVHRHRYIFRSLVLSAHPRHAHEYVNMCKFPVLQPSPPPLPGREGEGRATCSPFTGVPLVSVHWGVDNTHGLSAFRPNQPTALNATGIVLLCLVQTCAQRPRYPSCVQLPRGGANNECFTATELHPRCCPHENGPTLRATRPRGSPPRCSHPTDW